MAESLAEIERALLAAVLYDPQALVHVRTSLEPSDFADPRHGKIYGAAVALSDAGVAHDQLLVVQWLEQHGQLAAAGDRDYIGLLPVDTGVPAEHYARIVLEHAKRRALAAAAERLLTDASKDKASAAALAGDFVKSVQPLLADDQSIGGTGRLLVRSDLELESMPPMEWLADRLLPLGGLAAIYGAPEAGKSFVALDLAFSIACRTDWLGRSIANGGTMYIAGEGHGGLSQRIRAWKTAHAVLGQSVGVGVVSDAVNLLNPADVARIVFASKASALASPLRLIVLDTLARSMIGDENDTGDMSSVIAAADRIRTATGAAVLLVHHTRKDSDQERGSTALRGAVDTLILCEDGDDGRQIVCQKQKDAEKFSPIPFRLVAGFGSCIVQASVGADPGSASEQAGAMTPKRRAVLKTLCDAFTARGATTTEWFKAAAVPERTFYNVRTWLVREGYVTETGSRYTVSASGRHAATAPSTAIAANGTAKVTANHSPGPPKGGREVGSEAGGSGSTHGSNSAVDRNDDAYWGNLLEDDRGRFQ